MRNPRRILFLVTLGLFVFVSVRLIHQDDEGPVAQGRHLSDWVDMLGSRTTQGIGMEAEGAILELGTNCFPYILEGIQSEEIPWHQKLPTPVAHFIGSNHKLSERLRTRTERRIEGCSMAFFLLSKNATPEAIAQLTNLMNNTNAPQTAVRAAALLSYTGEKAIPSLVPVLQNPHPMRHVVLLFFSSNPDLLAVGAPAVPALIQCLKDPTYQTDVIAASVLGEIKAAPEITVPALVECLQSTNPRLRKAAAEGLGNFPENAALSHAALVALLIDPDAGVRDRATNALRKISPAHPAEGDPP